mmetsp:Transcript_43097/g.49525  ORF Transcript_43097/g.49525 Transcript_43097/m.49525 type:complete len:703 (+) Transcript_43097:95-2203(+)
MMMRIFNTFSLFTGFLSLIAYSCAFEDSLKYHVRLSKFETTLSFPNENHLAWCDFNGDGVFELLTFGDGQTAMSVEESTKPPVLDIPLSELSRVSNSFSSSKLFCQDFNGDSRADLILVNDTSLTAISSTQNGLVKALTAEFESPLTVQDVLVIEGGSKMVVSSDTGVYIFPILDFHQKISRPEFYPFQSTLRRPSWRLLGNFRGQAHCDILEITGTQFRIFAFNEGLNSYEEPIPLDTLNFELADIQVKDINQDGFDDILLHSRENYFLALNKRHFNFELMSLDLTQIDTFDSTSLQTLTRYEKIITFLLPSNPPMILWLNEAIDPLTTSAQMQVGSVFATREFSWISAMFALPVFGFILVFLAHKKDEADLENLNLSNPQMGSEVMNKPNRNPGRSRENTRAPSRQSSNEENADGPANDIDSPPNDVEIRISLEEEETETQKVESKAEETRNPERIAAERMASQVILCHTLLPQVFDPTAEEKFREDFNRRRKVSFRRFILEEHIFVGFWIKVSPLLLRSSRIAIAITQLFAILTITATLWTNQENTSNSYTLNQTFQNESLHKIVTNSFIAVVTVQPVLYSLTRIFRQKRFELFQNYSEQQQIYDQNHLRAVVGSILVILLWTACVSISFVLCHRYDQSQYYQWLATFFLSTIIVTFFLEPAKWATMGLLLMYLLKKHPIRGQSLLKLLGDTAIPSLKH